jgi:hypothetical protein
MSWHYCSPFYEVGSCACSSLPNHRHVSTALRCLHQSKRSWHFHAAIHTIPYYNLNKAKHTEPARKSTTQRANVERLDCLTVELLSASNVPALTASVRILHHSLKTFVRTSVYGVGLRECTCYCSRLGLAYLALVKYDK